MPPTCKHCRTIIKPGQLFCHECGGKVSSDAVRSSRFEKVMDVVTSLMAEDVPFTMRHKSSNAVTITIRDIFPR